MPPDTGARHVFSLKWLDTLALREGLANGIKRHLVALLYKFMYIEDVQGHACRQGL